MAAIKVFPLMLFTIQFIHRRNSSSVPVLGVHVLVFSFKKPSRERDTDGPADPLVCFLWPDAAINPPVEQEGGSEVCDFLHKDLHTSDLSHLHAQAAAVSGRLFHFGLGSNTFNQSTEED